jgi:hypothetical protein
VAATIFFLDIDVFLLVVVFNLTSAMHVPRQIPDTPDTDDFFDGFIVMTAATCKFRRRASANRTTP